MLNKDDFKYILKRVLTFLSIGAILCLLGSCQAKADTLPQPYSANLQMKINNQDYYLTNTNVNQFYSLTFEGQQTRYRLLIDENQEVSTITHVNITYNPVLNPNGPIYTTFKFAMDMSSFNSNSHPWLDIRGVYTYDNNTHNYLPCDIEGGYIDINNYDYVSNVRCYSTERIDQISINMGCYDSNSCSGNIPIKFGIEEMGYYTLNMTDAETIQAIQDLQNELVRNQIYQQMQDIDVNQFNSKYAEVSNASNIQNNTISQLILLPIQLLSAYKTSWTSNTCIPVNLGSLYGTPLILPCINISNYLGSTLWATIDYLMSGFLILSIAKKMIKVFDDLTNLRTNQSSELYGGGA